MSDYEDKVVEFRRQGDPVATFEGEQVKEFVSRLKTRGLAMLDQLGPNALAKVNDRLAAAGARTAQKSGAKGLARLLKVKFWREWQEDEQQWRYFVAPVLDEGVLAFDEDGNYIEVGVEQ